MVQLTLEAPAPRIPVPNRETTTCAFALRTIGTVVQTPAKLHWYTATGVCTFDPLTLTAVAAAGPVPLESALKREGATGLIVTYSTIAVAVPFRMVSVAGRVCVLAGIWKLI